MKINDFRGDLTDVSARKEALIRLCAVRRTGPFSFMGRCLRCAVAYRHVGACDEGCLCYFLSVIGPIIGPIIGSIIGQLYLLLVMSHHERRSYSFLDLRTTPNAHAPVHVVRRAIRGAKNKKLDHNDSLG